MIIWGRLGLGLVLLSFLSWVLFIVWLGIVLFLMVTHVSFQHLPILVSWLVTFRFRLFFGGLVWVISIGSILAIQLFFGWVDAITYFSLLLFIY